MNSVLRKRMPRYVTLAVTVCIIGASVLALWSHLVPAERETLLILLNRHPVLIVTVASLFPIVVLFAILWIFRTYIEPLRSMIDEIKVVQIVNPSYRLRETGSEEIVELAQHMNRALQRMQALEENIRSEMAAATGRAEEERNILAALIDEFANGVVVCNIEGQILLSNRLARILLAAEGGSAAAAMHIPGLGRSIFGFVDRSLVARALEVIAAKLADGQEPATTTFVAAGPADKLLRIECAPVLDAGRHINGYVLLATDVSPRLQREREVQVRLQAPSSIASRPEFYDFNLFGPAAEGLPEGLTPLSALTYTAFDTETTGLRPSEGDEIISIGAVRIVGCRLLRADAFDQLIDPGQPVPPEATRVHGIDTELVKGQPDIETVLPAFHRFVAGSVLVGHNVSFDLRFLQIKEKRSGVKFTHPVLDTLLLSAVVHPRHEDHTIEGIAGRLGVNMVGRHTALGDAIMTGEIFLKLLPLLADKHIHTLRDALDASRKTYLARIRY